MTPKSGHRFSDQVMRRVKAHDPEKGPPVFGPGRARDQGELLCMGLFSSFLGAGFRPLTFPNRIPSHLRGRKSLRVSLTCSFAPPFNPWSRAFG
jgi:hypothetical protein